MAEEAIEGQIVRLYAEVATVQVGERLIECAIRGRLYRADPPAVGDMVRIERAGAGHVITEVLPRKSALVRRAAGTTVKKQVMIANINQVIVVFAATKPEPTRGTLDRFLVVVEANNLEARIVVNKVDLVPREVLELMLLPYSEAGYPVHYTSVKSGEGLEEVREALKGKESALVGPSGVGKSSLLNALYPGLGLRVGQVSEAYGTGRHTTVGGLLIRLPEGASVADTAGLREVGLWLVPPNELPDCFPEFRPFLDRCRFSDCAHISEPDCAVQNAVVAGAIDPMRYESYVKMRAEAVEAWPRW
ncbi:MAG: ribosome small subunit-dependent GTPase A [Chloroflexota bacterium]